MITRKCLCTPYKECDSCEEIENIRNSPDLIEKLSDIKYELDYIYDEFPELLQPELFDHLDILVNSARSGKYTCNNWLEKDGKGCDHKSMYASIFRHISEAYCGKKVDEDSGLDPRLHAAIRLMMDYTRDKRGLNE